MSKNEKPSRPHGAWIDTLFASVGRLVRLETEEGVSRSGRMTGIRTKIIQVSGRKEEIVTELELNRDPNDLVSIQSLRSLNID